MEKVLPEHILSFIENYEQNNIWKLPFDLKNSQEVNIYETISSSQGIVRLKPMIKHEISINDIFRLAYAVLWREKLDEELKEFKFQNSFVNDLIECLSNYKIDIKDIMKNN